MCGGEEGGSCSAGALSAGDDEAVEVAESVGASSDGVCESCDEGDSDPRRVPALDALPDVPAEEESFGVSLVSLLLALSVLFLPSEEGVLSVFRVCRLATIEPRQGVKAAAAETEGPAGLLAVAGLLGPLSSRGLCPACLCPLLPSAGAPLASKTVLLRDDSGLMADVSDPYRAMDAFRAISGCCRCCGEGGGGGELRE